MELIHPVERKFTIDCDGLTAQLKVYWQGKELTLTQNYETKKGYMEARKEMDKVVHQMLALSALYPSQTLVLKGKKVTVKGKGIPQKKVNGPLKNLDGTAAPTRIQLSLPTENLHEIHQQLKAGSCKISNADYLSLLETLYGRKKIENICARYNIFPPSDGQKPLKADHARQLHVGLQDITGRDLDKILKGKTLSLKEQEALNKLGVDLKGYSQASDLPAPLFNALVHSLSSVVDSFPSEPLPLEKITGLPGKYFQHGWLSHRSGRSLEDEERLRLYDEIKSLSPNDQARYCELLSKILVKKHLYYEKGGSHDLKMGMLIPAPQGADGEPRWYRVSDIMDSGWGKFGYRLVPATKDYGADMPDMVLYRSSATLPTAMDAFTSYLNDINILPPGYLSRNRCKNQEVRWMTEATPSSNGVRPLLITGHSLGAATGQLALLNLQKSGQWPDRSIALELFDSPAIASTDAKKFAEWMKAQPLAPPIFHYYVSKKDPVPLAGSLFGSSYLGEGLPSAFVHKMELTEKGIGKPALAGLGPHGRLFLRGKKWSDYRVKTMSIEAFNKETKARRIAVNLARVVGTALIWPTVGAAGGLKRLFAGRRHHPPVLMQLLNRNRREEVAATASTLMQQAHCQEVLEPINLDPVIERAKSQDVRVFLKFLLSCKLTLKEVPFSLIKAVLLKKNPEMLAESRQMVQEIFHELYSRVAQVAPNSREEQQLEILIGDILTLYPFLEAHYEKTPKLQLPQKIAGRWQMVDYAVQPKRLTPSWMQPPVYAYKLQSNHPGASDLLLYAGTPPPTTTGEAISKWVDFIPGFSVGELLYKMAAKKIGREINKSYDRTQKPVKIYGKSLGGSMGLLTAVHHGPKVDVHAYNPAGLGSRMYALCKKNRQKWPIVPHVYSNKKDLVSELVGKFPPETQFYKIIPEDEANAYFAHIQTFLSGKKVSIVKLDPTQLNRQMRRKLFRVAYLVAACGFIIPNTIEVLFSSTQHQLYRLLSKNKV